MAKRDAFRSRWGFILSAVGSAVGMANVWGFPAKMGGNGGGAFLVAYLIFVALFSVVGLSAEYAVGRRARTGTLGSYKAAWATRGAAAGKAGGVIGWLPLVGSMCIALGYAVIIAYVLKAFWNSVTGRMNYDVRNALQVGELGRVGLGLLAQLGDLGVQRVDGGHLLGQLAGQLLHLGLGGVQLRLHGLDIRRLGQRLRQRPQHPSGCRHAR